MKTYRIDFTEGSEFSAIGRNGMMKCKGLFVNAYPDHFVIMPMTSKGVAGNCFIDIDRNSLADFIETLKYEEAVRGDHETI